MYICLCVLLFSVTVILFVGPKELDVVVGGFAFRCCHCSCCCCRSHSRSPYRSHSVLSFSFWFFFFSLLLLLLLLLLWSSPSWWSLSYSLGWISHCCSHCPTQGLLSILQTSGQELQPTARHQGRGGVKLSPTGMHYPPGTFVEGLLSSFWSCTAWDVKAKTMQKPVNSGITCLSTG